MTPKEVLYAWDRATREGDCELLLAVSTERYVRSGYSSCPSSNADLTDEWGPTDDPDDWKMVATDVTIHGNRAHVGWLQTDPEGRTTPGGLTMIKTPYGWKIQHD